MKANILAGIILSCSVLGTSCSDFLVEDPKGQMVESNYFKSQSDLDGAVNVLYEQVQRSLNSAHNFAPAWMGDDITAHTGGNKAVFREFDSFKVADNNADAKSAWSLNYSVIKAANFIINNAEKTPVSETEINIAKGQGLFWRAISHFKLVRWFGEIPVLLTTDIDFEVKKQSIENIYIQICADLEDAVSKLPESYTSSPRITEGLNNYINKGTAQAALAAVYMARAGYPLNQTEYYAKAAEMAKYVIDGTESDKYYFILEDNYKDRFMYVSNNYSKESVLGIKFNKNNPWGWSGLDSWQSVSMALESVTKGGWGDALPEILFFNNMPEGPRKDAIYGKDGGKIYVEKGKYEGQKINWYEKDDTGNYIVSEMHPMFRTLLYGGGDDAATMSDYDDDKTVLNDGISSQTIHMISYGEVLLWYAEAKARSGSVDDLAKECLQKILDRSYGAGVQSAEELASNPTDFADKCLLEHGYEIAGYYPALVTRSSDLLRINGLKDVFADRVTNSPVEVAPGVSMTEGVTVSGSWNDSMNYSVIPSFDSDLNGNL